MTIRIIPDTAETRKYLQACIEQSLGPGELPDIPMTDESARDINVIWRSIAGLASNWSGRRDACIPRLPADRKEFWGEFAKERRELLPVMEEFLKDPQSRGDGKIALDLGSGNSSAIPHLLAKGWRVIAVDTSRLALAILGRKNPEAVTAGFLQLVEESMASFTPSEPVDLVLAADALPYLDPAEFKKTWERIHDVCLKPGGLFIGSLFRITAKTPLIKLMGGWALWDRRMVRPLLISVGYEIKTCCYRKDLQAAPAEEPSCIQFIAQKKPS